MSKSDLATRKVPPRLLFVDDEQGVLRYLSKNVGTLGYEVCASPSWDEAKHFLNDAQGRPQIIFVEPLSTTGNGISIREICVEAHDIPVVVLSSSRDARKIVRAIRSGARDYFFKPLDLQELNKTIATILEGGKKETVQESGSEVPEPRLVFESPCMGRIHDIILQIADTQVPVLIQGESGVGKEVIARYLHSKSHLRSAPFVKVNCAALPTELVESELFGYRKGAFTGAHVDRPGKFEFANGGIIFLDEIGEFSSSIQAKLLQVLQEGRFTRLGGNRETEVDVRVVAATNRNLGQAIQEGSFREDLYYRLNVVNIDVPPLRDRREDIPPLTEYLLKHLAPQYNSTVTRLPERLQDLFLAYQWPGNVRELENLLKRYIVLQDAESIQFELDSKMARNVVDEVTQLAETQLRRENGTLDLKKISKGAAAAAEKKIIQETLRKTNWNKWKAATELGVSYKTLLTKITQYEIAPPSR